MAIHRHTLNLNKTEHRDLLAQTPVECISREPIKAGDTIVICATKPCEAKYYPDSWLSIGKKCKNCGQTDTLKVIPVRSNLDFKKGKRQQEDTTNRGPRWFIGTAQLALISIIIFSSIVFYLSREKENDYVEQPKPPKKVVQNNDRSPDKLSNPNKKMPEELPAYKQSKKPSGYNQPEWKPVYNQPKKPPVDKQQIELPPYKRPKENADNTLPTNLVSRYEDVVKSVVRNYSLIIKVKGTSDLNSNIWKSVLVDPILEQKLQSTCWLKNNGLQYIFSDQTVSITDISFDKYFSRATVWARISEMSGMKKLDGRIHSRLRHYDYRAIYQLKRINQKWWLYCLQALKEDDPNNCQVKLSDQNSCR